MCHLFVRIHISIISNIEYKQANNNNNNSNEQQPTTTIILIIRMFKHVMVYMYLLLKSRIKLLLSLFFFFLNLTKSILSCHFQVRYQYRYHITFNLINKHLLLTPPLYQWCYSNYYSININEISPSHKINKNYRYLKLTIHISQRSYVN
jgi:hypothetical protein